MAAHGKEVAELKLKRNINRHARKHAGTVHRESLGGDAQKKGVCCSTGCSLRQVLLLQGSAIWCSSGARPWLEGDRAVLSQLMQTP